MNRRYERVGAVLLSIAVMAAVGWMVGLELFGDEDEEWGGRPQTGAEFRPGGPGAERAQRADSSCKWRDAE